MSDTAAPASPAKKTGTKKTTKKSPAKKSSTTKKPSAKSSTGSKAATSSSKSGGGKYITAIISAIAELKHRGGSSRQAIAKALDSHADLDSNRAVHIRQALKRGVETGLLKQTGQSFALGDAAKKASKKKSSTATSTTGTSTAAKKATGTKKSNRY